MYPCEDVLLRTWIFEIINYLSKVFIEGIFMEAFVKKNDPLTKGGRAEQCSADDGLDGQPLSDSGSPYF